MSRPLRIEFPGATYHVTSRGDRQEAIFADDSDRRSFLDVLARAMERFDAAAFAYCLMDNHYHLVLTTRGAKLSALMRHVNGVHTQRFNRRHDKAGHVFQGRFKAILIDTQSYLLEACRYVELNPVRATMVKRPGQWPWSSYGANVGDVRAPMWLDTASMYAQVLGRDVSTAAQRRRAQAAYADLVATARDVPLWEQGLRQQIYLGDEAFVERMQAMCVMPSAGSVPRAQRSRSTSLAAWLNAGPTREEAYRRAHVDSGLTMTIIAREEGISVARVSQLIAKAERFKQVESDTFKLKT